MKQNSQLKRNTLYLRLVVSLVVLTTTLIVVFIFKWGNRRDAGEDANANKIGQNSKIEQLLRSQAPFTFVENKGQWDERIKFVARNGGMTAWIEKDAITLQLEKQQSEEEKKGVVTRLKFAGASDAVRLQGEKRQGGTRNFFMGNDSRKWQSGVAGYTQVLYQGLYPGIDLRLRPHAGNLEYDLLLQPGADLAQVVIECTGADGLEIQDDGSLIINTALGAIRQKLPTTWYELPAGEKQPVACNYQLLDDGRFGFTIADLNPALAVVIDPGLEYSTFLGGSGVDANHTYKWTVDEEGNLYLISITNSADFPVTSGAYEISFSGGPWDIVVVCFNPNLSGSEQLVWSTYLGGSGYDEARAVEIDASGSVFVVGQTNSTDFPTTSDAYNTTYNGGAYDGFLALLDASGSTLLYSTFMGGGEDDVIVDVLTDTLDNITIGGWTASADFPVTPAAYDTSFNGNIDGFVTRLDINLSGETHLTWSTFIGGGGRDEVNDLAADSAGAILVAGDCSSRDFPTTPGAFCEHYNGGPQDTFLARLEPDQMGHAQLSYSTFLGGTREE